MRLKSVVKYNIYDIKKGVIVYYVVIAAIMFLLTVMLSSGAVNIGNNRNGFVSGADATAIFLFVCGLNSFKQNYLYLSTNGITRKTQFYGFLISSAIIATTMAAIDTALTNIINIFINYRPMFYQIYEEFTAQSSIFLNTIMDFIWSTAIYFLALVIGYFITTLYYRISKMLKIIVSIGVPALYIIGSAILTIYLVKTGYMDEFNKLMGFIVYGNGKPALAVIIMLIEAAIVAGLSYLLVRRAIVKE